MQFRNILLTVALSTTLAACGGGGGGSDSPTTPPGGGTGGGGTGGGGTPAQDVWVSDIDAPVVAKTTVTSADAGWETPDSLRGQGLVFNGSLPACNSDLQDFFVETEHFKVWSEAGVTNAEVEEAADQLEAALDYILPRMGLDEATFNEVYQTYPDPFFSLTVRKLIGELDNDNTDGHLIFTVPLGQDPYESGDQRIYGMPYDFLDDVNYDGLTWPAPSDEFWTSVNLSARMFKLLNRLPSDSKSALMSDVFTLWNNYEIERGGSGNDLTLNNPHVWAAMRNGILKSDVKLGVCIDGSSNAGGPGRVGIVYVNSMFLASVSALKSGDRMTSTIRHELVHVIQNLFQPNRSTRSYHSSDRWFNEGVAEYVAGRETLSPRNAGSNPTREAILSESDSSYRDYVNAVRVLIEDLNNPLTVLADLYGYIRETGSFYIHDDNVNAADTPCTDIEFCNHYQSEPDGQSSHFFDRAFKATFLDAASGVMTVDEFRTYMDDELDGNNE